MMNGSRKSDRPVVATKLVNKVAAETESETTMAEQAERRGLAKGKTPRQNTNRAQDREVVRNALGRIRQAAVSGRRLGVTT